MKNNIVSLSVLLLMLKFIIGCSPDEYTYADRNTVKPEDIVRVELVPNHLQVLADGRAQLDLRPMLYTQDDELVPDERVKEEWLEYTPYAGRTITRHFSTTDVSLVGQTITTQVKIKGTSVVSDPVSFRVVAPLEEKYTSEITIPVVIHIIQTQEEIESFMGKYGQDRLELILQKLNHVFSGVASVNPVGVNTHVRFRFAVYDPDGKIMPEPGINRWVGPEIQSDNQYHNFLESQHLVWPASQYMNIWLISDRKDEYSYFGEDISEHCMPQYVESGISADHIPEGLSLAEYTPDMLFTVEQSGVIYKLQTLDEFERSYDNELIHYIGRYLGLLPTYSNREAASDYCEDTIDYALTGDDTWYKNAGGCYFRSENIMDDPQGVHCSVSKNQCERMRWVLEHCPDRAAWKSDFAFTGK